MLAGDTKRRDVAQHVHDHHGLIPDDPDVMAGRTP